MVFLSSSVAGLVLGLASGGCGSSGHCGGLIGGGNCTSTSPGGGGGGCSALSSCCSELPSAESSSCYSTANLGNATSCADTLVVWQNSGYCSGISSSGSGVSCASLSSCCAFSPAAERPSCDTVVSDNNESSCASVLSAYLSDGYCLKK